MADYEMKDKLGSAMITGALWMGMAAFTVGPALSNSQDYIGKTVNLKDVQNLEFFESSPRQPQQPQTELTKNIESYIGVPVEGDYDKDPDLDFRMQFLDGDITYDVYVHEEADGSNIENLNHVRELVEDAMIDNGFIYVRGKLKEKGRKKFDDRTGQWVQRAKIDPFYVGSVDMETGETKPIFTEGTGSPLYTADDYEVEYMLWEPGPIRIVWSSSWHHYPYRFTPSWDWDGDGIPNWRDPAPTIFGPHTDLNHNGVIDAWDITAPGYWGWYGHYWHYYYPHSHWWHIHDHWHTHNGWHNWHNDEDRGHRGDRGHYYGPRRSFDDNAASKIRSERATRERPVRMDRDSRIVKEDGKYSIRNPADELEKRDSRDIRQQRNTRSEDTYRRVERTGRQNPDLRQRSYERTEKPEKRYEKPSEVKPQRTDRSYERRDVQRYTPPQRTNIDRRTYTTPERRSYTPPKRTNRSYTAPKRTNRSYSQPSRSNRSYTAPSKSRSSRSYSSPSRSSKPVSTPKKTSSPSRGGRR